MFIETRLKSRISILPVTYFFLGIFSIMSQTMMIREFLVVVVGNELILGVLFFNWLFGIFIGALSGGAVADKSKNPALFFVLSILAVGMLLPLAITGTRLLYAFSGTAAGTYIGFFKVFLFSGILIVPLVFFLGFSFPLAARMGLPDRAAAIEKVQRISHIYIFEALGFLFGGIVYTFFLAGRVSPYLIAPLAALPLVSATSILLLRSKFYKTLSFALLLLVLDVLVFIPPVSKKLENITVKKRWQSVSPIPLVFSVDSRYQNIAVASLFEQHNLYLNTNFAAAFPNDDENRILAAQLICQHPSARRVMVIGDALAGLAKYLLNYHLDKIVSVEIDPQVVHTLLRFLPEEEKQFLAEQRFQIEIKDGRKYVKDLLPGSPPFDLVYLNVPEPSTLLLNRYYTVDFFLDVAKILKQDGVVAFKITSSENYGAGLVSDYTASIYHTVKSVFPQVVVAPGPQNFVFASRKPGILTDKPEILARRYARAGVEPGKLGMIFKSLYPADKTRFIKDTLENSPLRKINRDDLPTANFYFSKIIGWYAGPGPSSIHLAGVLDFFESIGLKELLLFVLIMAVLRLIYLRMRRKSLNRLRVLKSHALAAVFACGMAGLSLELVILYTFQNVFGYIYHMIGLVIAVFMFGLPLGAHFSNRLLGKRNAIKETGVITLMIFLQIALAAVTIFLSTDLFNQMVLFFLTMVVGFIVGMVFPLAIHIFLDQQENTGKTAGLVDACDHLGAAVGAFFVGTLFLPLLGVFHVCLLLALCLLLSSSLLLTDLKGTARTCTPFRV